MRPEVAAWFATRTYRGPADLVELAARKAEADTSVVVLIPALDEAATVAGIVEAAVTLRGTLVDDVVVLDGGSGDATAAIAAAAGATVLDAAALDADVGPLLGKGDSLWRGVGATTCDIVVFVDADIRNPHPRFVASLLAPLLLDPTVSLAKGFYERPLEPSPEGGTAREVDPLLYATGGGRVTELLARPLLNLFWPELAGLVQPLSGEYAVRRELLEAIPFFAGYGVELGMLIDALRLRGAAAIAQVDLTERVHRNQTLQALSRMAYGIAQVAVRRLTEDGRLAPGAADAADYVQFSRIDGVVGPVPAQVDLVERPLRRSYASGSAAAGDGEASASRGRGS